MSIKDIRRYIEKQKGLEKHSLEDAVPLITKLYNEIIVSKAEIDAKKNVEEGTLTTFDVPVVTSKPYETKGMRFTPEPRKVGSPFWYYVVKKIRKEEKRTNKIPEGSFLDKYLEKWSLLSDKQISVCTFMFCECRNIRRRHRRRRSAI